MAQLPGKMKRKRWQSDLVAVGDTITVSINEDGSGRVESVAERKSRLARARPSASNRKLDQDTEQVLVANIDQIVFVCSLRAPETSLRKLDRFLVVAEQQNLSAVICINKIDLGTIEEARAIFELYETLDYPVYYVSAHTGEGLDPLRDLIREKITVFSGSSGVGKSSLLNAIEPQLGQKVSNVSNATGKGMHTTRYAEMFPLDDGGYVADTPGIRGIALFDLDPSEIDAYFREIEPFVADCQFSDCTHRHEKKCAVLTAVKDGHISDARYDSYCRLYDEHKDLDNKLF